MKYNALKNFHAKKLSSAISSIEDLAPQIAIHTILLLIRSNDQEITHWRKEIQTWLTKLRNINNLKIPGGKLNRNTISYHLFGEPLGLISDIKSTLQNAISDEDNIAPIKVDVSDYNLDNLYISLAAIYEDYINYIDKLIDLSELQRRMNKYYLYDGN